MFHPLIRLLASKPQLLVHHMGGYVELASAQAADMAEALQARLRWSVLAVGGLALGAVFAGMALMLVAVVPLADMPQPWLLALVPGVPLLGGAGAWVMARRAEVRWDLAPLREQFAADAALLAEAADA